MEAGCLFTRYRGLILYMLLDDLYFAGMNKSLVFALSVLLFGFKFAIPAHAYCGHCDEDQAAQKVECETSSATCEAAKKDGKAKCDASAQKCKAKGKKTLEERVVCMEQCLKDVGSSDGSGSPYSSKTKDYSKKKAQCPMLKCPKARGSCPREKRS